MSTVNGFQVGSETLKYNYESLENYNTPNFSTSSSTTYAVGDYVMYNGKLYKCTTATTGGTWVSGSWAETVLSDDVNDLSRHLSDIRKPLDIPNLITIGSSNELKSNTDNPPTISYGQDNKSVTLTGSTAGSSVGWYFQTVIGTTYTVTFQTNATSDFVVTVTRNRNFSSTTYIYKNTFSSGSHSFEFTATTNETTLWFGSPRNSVANTISNIFVKETGTVDWYYGNLSTVLTSEYYPPTSKAVGDALIPNIIGETNTFAGKNAGKNTVESQDTTSSETYDLGRYNAAFGTDAFRANTEGHHSTGLGFCALRNNTTGAFNTAVGEDACYNNTTNSGNTGVGSHVLQTNTGNYNTSVGAESSRYPVNANYNVSIGYHANYSPYDGDNNVYIGADAGTTANASNSIAIGNGAKVSGSNQIVIGNANNTEVRIAGKTMVFNQDGTVTWS